jgi:hypothetical protein
MAATAQSQSLPRRGWFISRVLLQPASLRQHRRALAAAAHMVLLLPLIQAALLVLVLKAEPWQALLGAEGLVISWLAASQFRRVSVEGKLAGYGIAMLNAVALGVAGVALGGHVLWLSGAATMAAVTWLAFAETGAHTVRNAWLALAVLLLPMVLFCAASRWALEASASTEDPASRGRLLSLAWAGYHLRGGNGSERALLRLRQAQAAFEQGEYAEAFQLAHDGAFDERGNSRVPASAIGEGLLDSLLRLKAQSLYNMAWNKSEPIQTLIRREPLGEELLDAPDARVRWGW